MPIQGGPTALLGSFGRIRTIHLPRLASLILFPSLRQLRLAGELMETSICIGIAACHPFPVCSAMTYLPGIVVLLLAIGNIRRGEADLLGMFMRWEVSVDRAESGFLFWCAVIVELLIGAGLLLVGRLIEVAMS